VKDSDLFLSINQLLSTTPLHVFPNSVLRGRGRGRGRVGMKHG